MDKPVICPVDQGEKKPLELFIDKVHEILKNI